MIQQLEDEIREYDELKSGDLTLPNVERLDQIVPFVTKMRIAKGVSQIELARRPGVSKQVITVPDKLPVSLKYLLVVGYHIGNRKGTLLNLKWSQIDFEEGLNRF